jgi:hypothetical protein
MAIATTVILPVGMPTRKLITLKPVHTHLGSMTLLEFVEHAPAIGIKGLNVGMGEDGLLE